MAETAEAMPIVADQIRSWLPDHTAISDSGLFNPTTTWQWTTRAGLWTVELTTPAFGFLRLIGPGGEWQFGRGDAALAQLHGVLVALGAIGGES